MPSASVHDERLAPVVIHPPDHVPRADLMNQEPFSEGGSTRASGRADGRGGGGGGEHPQLRFTGIRGVRQGLWGRAVGMAEDVARSGDLVKSSIVVGRARRLLLFATVRSR